MKVGDFKIVPFRKYQQHENRGFEDSRYFGRRTWSH
jgi:hypothetical protein